MCFGFGFCCGFLFNLCVLCCFFFFFVWKEWGVGKWKVKWVGALLGEKRLGLRDCSTSWPMAVLSTLKKREFSFFVLRRCGQVLRAWMCSGQHSNCSA